MGGEVSGNYPTVNNLVSPNIGSTAQGNLQVTTQSSNYGPVVTTLATSGSGKWYAEIKWDSGTHSEFGLAPASSNITGSVHLHDLANSFVLDSYAGQIRFNGGNNGSASVSSGDLVGIAFDETAGTVQFFVNGSSVGTLNSNGASGGVPYLFGTSDRDSASTSTYTFNFGQRSFTHSAPSTYKALCTTNLPTPTIADASDYFQSVIYTGNGGTQTISTTGLSPDLVWIKGRSGATDHVWCDIVRGAGYRIRSNLTSAEDYGLSNVSAFNANSFDIGNNSRVNTNGATYVSWNWDGGSTTSTINSGDANSTAYNSDETWSTSITSPQGGYAGSTSAQAVNGNVSNGFEAGNPSGSYSTIRFEPSKRS